jgi:SAM-dependent methyltransferase
MFDRTAHLYDLLYAFKDYEAESVALVELIRSRNPAATSVLDVACGTGRHLELLRASFSDLAGVDLEPGLLDVARTRLSGVSLTHGDMRTFDLGRYFDAVTCLFSSVGTYVIPTSSRRPSPGWRTTSRREVSSSSMDGSNPTPGYRGSTCTPSHKGTTAPPQPA